MKLFVLSYFQHLVAEHHEDFREWVQFYYNITPFDSCEGLGNKKAPVCRIQERKLIKLLG